VAAIQEEFDLFGDEEALECLHYVRHEAAGSNPTTFSNGGIRDAGRQGEMLGDFVSHPNSVNAALTEGEVVALRVYTTAAYRVLNQPLRAELSNANASLGSDCPFPVTVTLLASGIRKLRANSHRDAQSAGSTQIFWRGIRGTVVPPSFEVSGGTEAAAMSTTSDLRIALRYSASADSLLFRIVTSSFMEQGADLTYLSAFAGEAEYLYPPLTYLLPTGQSQKITIAVGGVTFRFTVVEVIPQYGT
jgi:hypothetical protein